MGKDKKAAKETTLIYFLLDTSGSMAGKWRETLMALEAYVIDQQTVAGKAAFVFAQFDSPGRFRSERFADIRKIDDPVALAPAWPDGGSTALFDATMTALDQVRADTSAKRALIILTDGEENASLEWAGRGEDVRRALDRAEADDIGVMFLAVGVDAWANERVYAHRTVRVAGTAAAARSSVDYASAMTMDLRADRRSAVQFSDACASVDADGTVSEGSPSGRPRRAPKTKSAS